MNRRLFAAVVFNLGGLRAAFAVLAVLAVLPALAGCAHAAAPTEHPIVGMATFDLNCPKEQLLYQKIDEETWGVLGCGQRVKYVRICRQVRTGWSLYDECRWVKN